VRTLELIGVARVHDDLVALGIALMREPDYYGAALALGGADVTLMALTERVPRARPTAALWSETRTRRDAAVPPPVRRVRRRARAT
jgi:hypothetical protein